MNTYFSKYFVLIALFTFSLCMIAVKSFQPQAEVTSIALSDCFEGGLSKPCKLQNEVPSRPTVFPGAGVKVDPSNTVATRPEPRQDRARPSFHQLHMQIAMETMVKVVINEMNVERQAKDGKK